MALMAFAPQSSAAQWVTNVVPTKVVVGGSGGEYLQIMTSSAIVNPASCGSADSYVLRDPTIVKSAIAVALAALAAGRQIQVYVTDTCDAPTGRPLTNAIGVM